MEVRTAMASMFARPSRKVAGPPAVATCPSCDADLPAGSHYCGTCGAPAQAPKTAQLTEQDLAMQRHAELLGVWLETEVKRSWRLKPVLLVTSLGALFLAGAYLLFQGKSGDRAPVTRAPDSSMANVAIEVVPRETEMRAEPLTAAVAVVNRRVPQISVRRKAVATAPAPATVKNVRPAAPGVLLVLVTPWALVSIDGRAGIRRARGTDTLAAGIPHRLHFERPGFAAVDTIVTLRPSEERLLEVQMKPATP